MKPRKDLTGQRFGRLTVVKLSDKRAPRGARTVPLWECRCDCGSITYKATDTLKNADISMCSECSAKYAAEKMRENAGFVNGTQLGKIRVRDEKSMNSSGIRGVYYDKSTGKWRARLKFQGKLMNFGTYTRFEEAVEARKKAEFVYYGEFLDQYEMH